MATVRNCGFIALWLCAKLSPIQAQAVPEDALEKVRAELESGPVTLARRMTELTCLLRLDRQDEVPATARACAALLAPGRLAPALKGLAESTLGLEPALALVRTLCQRGRCDTALPILLALHREAPNDLRVLIALGEVLDPSSPLPDRELARTSLETALDLLDSPRSGALPAGTDLLRAVEYFSSPGNTNDLAALRDRVEADLVLVARGESLPRRTPSLAHCSEAIARLNSARERGDQVALVDSARQLASWLGGNPALAFVLGAALVSAGPACSRDEGKA